MSGIEPSILRPVLGYIGPGAGFAFLGSFLLLFSAILIAVLSLLLFPIRAVFSAVRGVRTRRKSKADRVVLLGMDGFDPRLAREMMAGGGLPHLRALAERGTFLELDTTRPPISPVAWSSFATGVNPGKHGIFDFLNRNPRTRVPELSSCRIRETGGAGFLRRRRAEVELLRKSKPFWQTLGEHGVPGTIMRVPITFPAEPFRGLMLSGMCVPDLRGTQGTFTFYESETGGTAGTQTVGLRIPVETRGGRIRTHLPGPSIGPRQTRVELEIEVGADKASAVVRLPGARVTLRQGVYSNWTQVVFQAGRRRAHGVCRFLLIAADPVFKLYVTPINIDPAHPSLPISHPRYYSIYLAGLHGPFATLGLAEDTWAVNEGVLDDVMFLDQTYAIHKEREEMFLGALHRTRRGVCACVFDLTDRIQHMFYRYSDPGHPAGRPSADVRCVRAIEDSYKRMDALVGRAMESVDDRTVFAAVSDHGFRSFRRCVNLNAWLAAEGFLAVRKGSEGAEYLGSVDWTATRAYSFGLAGIYLNLSGRESGGIVSPGAEEQRLKAEIAAKLTGLLDPSTGGRTVRAVHDAAAIYSGPYSKAGPDLVVGYETGYRASWDTAIGRTDGDVLSDNTKSWSGDHCIDSDLVPGVFFCNRKVTGKARPHICDLAPTVLSLFGIEPPGYIDGKVLEMSGS